MITEEFLRFPKISEEAPMMFRSYSNISKYFFKGLWNHSDGDHFSNYGNHNDGDLFTCEDNVLSSRVKIWSSRGKAHLVFHWCLCNKV